MFYNFWIFLLILSICSPINAYNRGSILKDITIENEIIIISTGLIFIFILSQLVQKKEIIPKKIKTKTIMYCIVNIILASISLYIGGMIIQRDNILKFKAIQKPVYLIVLIIIAVMFYEKREYNFQVYIGIGLLILGCILIDYNFK